MEDDSTSSWEESQRIEAERVLEQDEKGKEKAPPPRIDTELDGQQPDLEEEGSSAGSGIEIPQQREESPEEWGKHHITELSLAQRDFSCFGLFNYLPAVS